MENKEEQLIEEAKRRGFLREGNEFYSCFDDRNKIRVIKPYDSNSNINLYLDCVGYLRYDSGLNNEYDCSLCSNPAIYKDGVWAEIVSESLEQQLQKAEAEVKRLQSLIEEENKPKVGDWALELHSNNIIKATEKSSILYLNSKEYCKKITNKELIKLLNDEIK